MEIQGFGSIWDAIEPSDETASFKVRSWMLMALERHIKETGLSQKQAARQLGVTQTRVSDLMRGKIQLFSLDMLVNMVAAAGMHVEMRISESA